ncbi:hypothetical protein BASA81_003482 [Batrachochytrium salamandrivorans]|nr:hypothetical protein BASA81_003482 [Batrachochytrium salamandrivorans]
MEWAVWVWWCGLFGGLGWLLAPGLARWLRFLGHGLPPRCCAQGEVKVRFGVLGAARIAPRALFHACYWNPSAQVTCLAARDFAQAQRCCRYHRIPHPVFDYLQVVRNPNINAVYIPLPNSLHFHWTKQSLLAGKHCLVEKPLCSNAREARELVELAKQRGLVLMEASHSFYHPALQRMRQLVRAKVGRITHVEARFHSHIRRDGDIRFNAELGGGSLMDNGGYVINAIRFMCFPALRLTAESCVWAKAAVRRSSNGGDVDERMEAEFRLDDDAATAFISTSLTARRVPVLTVTGTKGSVTLYNFLLPSLWHCIVVTTNNQRGCCWPEQHYGDGGRTTYEHQLAEFIRRVALTTTSPESEDSIDPVTTMAIIDSIYLRAGMRPPCQLE